MSATGGYTSDVNLNDINYVGDFPAENSLGGAGSTTGGTDDYALALTPALTQPYRQGLLLQVKFNHLNTGNSTLNVDGKGAVPIMKITGAGTLVNVEPNDLNTTTHYILAYDGTCFQVASGIVVEPGNATEADEGIVRFATTPESNDPANNTTAVTPQKMIAYVSDKVTGLWKNKGVIDCSTNPNYPAGQSGDAYTVSVAGKIGGAAGVYVQAGDVIHCLNDKAGGDQATVGNDWNVMQANLVQATEIIAGVLKIATQAQTDAGTDDTSAITALKLATHLNNKNATEALKGLIQIATQAIVNTGTNDQQAVTPLKLKVRLDNYLNRDADLEILVAHISPSIYHTPGRNHYGTINGNMVVTKDIRLKRTGGVGTVSGWKLNFPKPLNLPTGSMAGTVTSNKGQNFFYSINSNGQVTLSGEFLDPNDELLLNMNPYLAKFPIEYHASSPT